MKVSGISNLWVFVFPISIFQFSTFYLQAIRFVETYDIFNEATDPVDGHISDNPLICSETMQRTWLIYFHGEFCLYLVVFELLPILSW
jgi:hypothetical protein